MRRELGDARDIRAPLRRRWTIAHDQRGLLHRSTVAGAGTGLLLTDIEGNIWVANSDWLDSPYLTTQLGTAANPSITMFKRRGRHEKPHEP